MYATTYLLRWLACTSMTATPLVTARSPGPVAGGQLACRVSEAVMTLATQCLGSPTLSQDLENYPPRQMRGSLASIRDADPKAILTIAFQDLKLNKIHQLLMLIQIFQEILLNIIFIVNCIYTICIQKETNLVYILRFICGVTLFHCKSINSHQVLHV